jgi:hypothetical protein
MYTEGLHVVAKSSFATSKKSLKDDTKNKNAVTTIDLVKCVAEAHDLSKAASRRIIDTIVDTINDVCIYRFNFSV